MATVRPRAQGRSRGRAAAEEEEKEEDKKKEEGKGREVWAVVAAEEEEEEEEDKKKEEGEAAAAAAAAVDIHGDALPGIYMGDGELFTLCARASGTMVRPHFTTRAWVSWH